MLPALTWILDEEVPSSESIALGDVNITTYSSPQRAHANREIIPTGVLSELIDTHSCDSSTESISAGLLQSIESKPLHIP